MTCNKFIVLIALTLMLSCVKYSFKGALPSYLKNIYIEDFENQTQYPLVRQEFMDKVTQAFIQDNTLNVVDSEEGADLILSGAITSINRRPVAITQTEQVQEFHMVVNIRAECLNVETQKPLWKRTLSRYGVISGNALRDEIDLAISDAVDQIVEDVMTNTIAAW